MHLLKHFKELTIRPKNAQELKGLILQLAIQGKLTTKWRLGNPDIEEASELLKRIKNRKAQLIKEKKIKKEKPLPEVNKNPFELPNNWTWCRLNDLGIIGSGSRVHKKDWQSEGVPFYRAREIVKLSKFGQVDNSLFITEELFNKFKENGSVPEQNDIMITGVGTIGIPYIVNKEDRFYFKDASVLIFKNIFNLYSGYLNLFFSCQYWINEIHKDSMGTTVHTLTISRAKLVPTILPPLEEQKEIVKVVETLFKEVEQLEQLTLERISLKEKFVASALNQLTTNNSKKEWAFLQDHFKIFFNETTNIKKLRKTVLQLAVQGKLTSTWRASHPELVSGSNSAKELLKRIQKEKAQLIKEKKIKKEKSLPPITKDEIPFELPEGWVWCRLGEVINLKSGQDLKPNEYSDTNVIGLPYVTGASNLKKEKVIISRWTDAPRSIAFRGDLLITCKGSGVGKMGWLDEESAHIARQIMAISTFCSPLDYIKVLMDVNAMIYRKNAIGLIPGIDRKTVLETLIGCPPLEEQKGIVQKVNTLMGLCDALEQQVQQSQEQSEKLMQSVLREVFEGKKELEVI